MLAVTRIGHCYDYGMSQCKLGSWELLPLSLLSQSVPIGRSG